MEETTVTRASFARLCKVSRKTVTVWAREGRVVLGADGRIDVAPSRERLRMYRRDGVPEALRSAGDPAPVSMTVGEARAAVRALDWQKRPHNWTAEAQDRRAAQAATAVGFEVLRSDVDDDAHFGGFRVSDPALVKHHGRPCMETVIAGYGFELEPTGVFDACRLRIDNPDDGPVDLEDVVHVRPDLLHTLAYPWTEFQTRPRTTA